MSKNKCEKCGKKLEPSEMKVRDSIDGDAVEVGIKCRCGADYCCFVKITDLVLMN